MRKYLLSILAAAAMLCGGVFLNDWRNAELIYRAAASFQRVAVFCTACAGFAVAMPTPIEPLDLPAEAPAENLTVHSIGSSDRGNSFTVSYSDYPAGFVDDVTPAVVLARIRDGMPSRYPGYECSHKSVTVDGFDGVEITLENPKTGGVVRVLATLVKSRVYVALARAERRFFAPHLFERFFGSFKIASGG